MAKIVAAVTCDLVRSQRYSTEVRKRVDSVLKKEFAKVYKAYPMLFTRLPLLILLWVTNFSSSYRKLRRPMR